MKLVLVLLVAAFVFVSAEDENLLDDLDKQLLFDVLQQDQINTKNDGNVCANKANGDYPDPSDCSKYITCSNGLAISDRNCPSGLYFNPKTSACDYPKNVDCKSKGSGCSGKADGDYPDPKNCYGFIKCSNGISYSMNCPSGLKYNKKTKRCDFPGNVDCSANDDVQYDTSPSKDPFCKDKGNGNYVNPYKCEGFIMCSNHLTYFFDCPSILQYNPKTDRCDWPDNVQCGPTPNPSKAPRPPTPSTSSFCKNRANGNYVDPNNCYGFIMCSNHLTYFFDCPADLKYNAKTDRCDWPRNVKCGPTPKPTTARPTTGPVTPSPSGFCKNRANGNYVDPNNCHGFIMCSNHLTYFFDCPANLEYNVKTDRCDWPWNVKCGPTSKPTPSPRPTKGPVTPSPSRFCRNRPNGNYVDPNNCHGFIMCSNHLTYFFDCPANLEYNVKTDRCDWPWNVKCGPTPEPTPTPRPTTRPVTPSPSRFCRNRPNGNYVDPNNCYGFIMCSNHLTYFFDCPADLKYNAKTDRCDWPWNVKCGPTSGPTHAPAPTPSRSNFCKNRGDGNYVDPNNCNGFIMCSNYLTYFFDCPASLRYNAKTDRCDWPRNVKCPHRSLSDALEDSKINKSPFCTLHKNGNYRDITNCEGYFTCYNGYQIFRDCPGTQRFNPQTRRCDLPRNVKCGGAGGGTRGSGFCKRRRNGDYRDVLNCNGFIKCSNSYTYYFDCPANLRFNRRTDRCDWPRNVRCRYPEK